MVCRELTVAHSAVSSTASRPPKCTRASEMPPSIVCTGPAAQRLDQRVASHSARVRVSSRASASAAQVVTLRDALLVRSEAHVGRAPAPIAPTTALTARRCPPRSSSRPSPGAVGSERLECSDDFAERLGHEPAREPKPALVGRASPVRGRRSIVMRCPLRGLSRVYNRRDATVA